MKNWRRSNAVLTHGQTATATGLSYADALCWWLDRGDSGPYIYRGQEKDEWSIKPAIARYESPPTISAERFEKEILDGCREMVKHFRSEAPFLDDVLGVPPVDRTVDPDSAVPNSEAERLLLPWEMAAQHYGVPTRLVDWSTSFQMALFFAYGGWSGMQIDDRLAPTVWCLDRGKLKEGALAKASSENSVATVASYESGSDAICVLPRDRYINRRQRAQFGWFTYMHSSLKGVPEYLDENEQYFPGETLIQLVLQPHEQEKVLRTLAESGITAAAIRGDLEGVARDAVNEHLRFHFSKSKAHHP